MIVEIPIVCLGNNVLTKIGDADKPINTVNVSVEMVRPCEKLGTNDRCGITGENCMLKPRKLVFNDGIGDGDEEFID